MESRLNKRRIQNKIKTYRLEFKGIIKFMNVLMILEQINRMNQQIDIAAMNKLKLQNAIIIIQR